MDVGLLRERAARLHPDLLAEVQERVHDRRSNARKRETVREGESRREEERRIRLVLGDVERALGRDDARDVVIVAQVVIRPTGGDRHVLGVPSVGVVEHGRKEPEEEHEPGRDVRGGPPGRRERGANVRNLGPVEGDEGHAQAGVVPEELVDDDVFRRNPTDPVEEREGLEDVAGEEVPAKGADKHIYEEPLTRDTAAGTHTGVLLRVEGVEERAVDQICWPDHRRGRDQEAASNATDGEPDLRRLSEKHLENQVLGTHKLRRHDDHPLVAEVIRLIVVHSLDRDDVGLQPAW